MTQFNYTTIILIALALFAGLNNHIAFTFVCLFLAYLSHYPNADGDDMGML